MKKKTSNIVSKDWSFEEIGKAITASLIEAYDDDSVSKKELLEILSGFVCLITASHDEIMKKLEEFE